MSLHQILEIVVSVIFVPPFLALKEEKRKKVHGTRGQSLVSIKVAGEAEGIKRLTIRSKIAFNKLQGIPLLLYPQRLKVITEP